MNNCCTAIVYTWSQGKPEYLGRCLVKPKVKLEGEAYTSPEWPPALEWHDVYRGPRQAGELLAAFELLKVPCSKYQLYV